MATNSSFLIVDQRSNFIGDTDDSSLVGIRGRPFARLVPALPLDNGPVVFAGAQLVDQQGRYVGDVNGTIVGDPDVVVHRMLSARWTEDTRGLAG